jgi:hypothetical protein
MNLMVSSHHGSPPASQISFPDEFQRWFANSERCDVAFFFFAHTIPAYQTFADKRKLNRPNPSSRRRPTDACMHATVTPQAKARVTRRGNDRTSYPSTSTGTTELNYLVRHPAVDRCFIYHNHAYQHPVTSDEDFAECINIIFRIVERNAHKVPRTGKSIFSWYLVQCLQFF